MLTSRQRAYLRSMANGLDTILQVGKDGISDNTIEQVKGSLETRELIKCRVLETSPLTSREAADALALAARGEVVQVIGTRFVLFRIQQDKKKRKIELPKKEK